MTAHILYSREHHRRRCLSSLLLRDEGNEALKNELKFPNTSKVNNKMTVEEHQIIPLRQTRNDAKVNPGNNYVLFHDSCYLITGDLDAALTKVHEEISKIVNDLNESLNNRLGNLINDPLLSCCYIFGYIFVWFG